ncbi:MAG: hypothetical protein ABJE66_34615, partial [Deltaproteobacteria bacterium]
MGEFASRGPTHAGASYATSGTTSSPAREASPADRARDAVAGASHKLTLVRAAMAELTAAYGANDLPRWNHAHKALEVALVQANQRFEQTRTQLTGATPETTSTFDAASRELTEASERSHATEAPKGYVQVALEAELLAALRAPSIAGFAGRRDAVRAELDQLAIAELRVLRARIASPQAQDELAQEIWKLGPQLRQEVADFIHNVDRRKARERAAEVRRKPTTIALEPESLDTKLRRAFEGSHAETELLAVIAPLDFAARRTLATRLRTYRPGSGDDVAARFTALDPVARERILMELARDRPPVDVVHAAPSMLETSSVFDLAPAERERTREQLQENLDHVVHAFTGPAPKPPEQYLREHGAKAWDVIGRYLRRVQFPAPSPRLEWRDDVAFADATVHALSSMALFARRQNLVEVLFPADPFAQLAGLIPIGDEWVPTIGSALGQLFEQAIVDSLRRLGPRWIEIAEHRPRPEGLADEDQSLVSAADLIASAPIDLAVRRGLTGRAVVALTDTHRLAPRDGAVRSQRHVELEWQGSRDRAMWNWVHVTKPSDASVEEVSAALWPNAADPSTRAYRLVASGSYFGVPADWARELADARSFAPDSKADANPDTQLVALANGKHADELALDSAAHHRAQVSKASTDVLSGLSDVALQLDHLTPVFAAWQLGEEVATASRWVTRKQHELATASPHERAKWQPVVLDQKDRVSRIAQASRDLVAAKPPAAKDDPVRRIITTYARAIATSFLGDASERLIANAAHEQTTMAMTALRASTNDLAVVIGDGSNIDPKQLARSEELATNSREMQSRMIAGQTADPDALERVTIGTQELALHLRIEQVRKQLGALKTAAAEVSSGTIARIVGAFPGKFHDIDLVSSELDNHLVMVESAWDYGVSGARQIRDPDEYAREMLRLRSVALGRAQARFAAIKQDEGLVTFLESGASVIEHEAKVVGWVTACVQLLAMIGISIVTNAAGSAIARTIASWGVGAEAAETATVLARGARIVGRVVGGATEAAGNTAGQRAIQGNPDDSTFLEGMAENALMTFGSELILARIGKDLEFAKSIERSTGSMWSRAKTAGAVLLARSVTISSHVIINAASSYVAHQIVKYGQAAPSNATLGEWFLQGAAVAIGRYVHGQIAERRELYTKLALVEKFGSAKRLLRDADSLLALANTAESAPSDRHALELLARQRQLLGEELAVLEAAASDPAKQRALDIAAPTLRAMENFAKSRLAELDATDLAEIPLRHAQLEELIPGELWKGTERQIKEALEAAGEANMSASGERDANGVWKLRIGQRTVTVNEIESAPRGAREGEPAPKTRELIRKVGSSKAFGEQHAHAPGSVPIDAVLGMVDEWPHITNEQRTEQITLLEELIAEFTADKQERVVSDLSAGSVDVRNGEVGAPKKVTIASTSGAVELGLLNEMLKAKRELRGGNPRESEGARVKFDEILKKYRSTIGMQKPDGARYDASIDTTYEFFVRYKMIAAHGLTTAEIATRRASAEQLGMQELRYGSDHSSVPTLHAEADQLLRRAPLDADVSNTFATTKNRLATPDAAKNEQQLVVEFVKAWEADPTLERAFNGFESAGVEDARKPPALLWEAAAQRTFRNALRARGRLTEELQSPADVHALAERLARASGTVADAEAMLNRYRAADYEAALAATDERGRTLRASATATMPDLDPRTQQINERFAGLTIEETAADTRMIVEAMRAWSAETGIQHGDV